MITCLDINESTNDPLYPGFTDLEDEKVQINLDRSLRDFFRQLAHSIALVMPLFYDQRFRLSHFETVGSLILTEVRQNLKSSTDSSTSESPEFMNEIENYVNNQVEHFGIKSNGLCKYCSLFHIDLDKIRSGKSQSLQSYLLNTIKSNEAFCDVVTSMKLEDEMNINSLKAKQSVQLNKELLNRLTNLADISIKNIGITEMDLFVKECKNLKNLKLVGNNLSELPAELFDMFTSLMQVFIDNNPIVNIPASLFSMQSLRSLSLSRLNVVTLPDQFLEKLEGLFKLFF